MGWSEAAVVVSHRPDQWQARLCGLIQSEESTAAGEVTRGQEEERGRRGGRKNFTELLSSLIGFREA